jgi:hypothetical protein
MAKSVPRKLSEPVKKALTAQFSLDPQTVDKMRLSSRKGRFSDRPAEFIRIFAPALIENGESATPSYEETYGHRKALLFEGCIEKNDRIYLNDRRIPCEQRCAPTTAKSS